MKNGGLLMTTENIEKYVEVEKRVDATRDKYAKEEGYINRSEATSPWIPFLPGVMIRHLSFDITNNNAVNILKLEKGAQVSKHRHRGIVTGYCLKGSWYYAEYDWVAKPGDFIREAPGREHTLCSDEGMETVFHLNGSLEFLDENDRIIEIVDAFWFIDHYERYCREHNIPINKELYL